MRRLIHEGGEFKAVIVDATEIGRAYFRGAQPSPIALQLVTQAMTGVLLLSTDLKDEGTLLMRLGGEGPMGQITVEANTDGHVRGFTQNAAVDFERVEGQGMFQTAIGAGMLKTLRRTQHMTQPYESVTELIPGEIALNMAHYLLSSNQIQSGIQLGASLHAEHGVAGAGGILIEAMPGANQNLLFIVEDRLTTMPGLGTMFAEPGGMDRISEYLFDDIAVKSLGETGVVYRCSCSRQRMLQIISTLPVSELAEMVAENKDFEINCQFCNKAWPCSTQDLSAVIEYKNTQKSE